MEKREIMGSQVKEKQEKKRLGERLVDAGLIDEIQLAVALGMQKQTGLKIGKQLLKLGFISEDELSPFLSEQTDMSISLAQRNITPQTIKSVPQDLAFRYKVIPVAFDGKTIVLAMSDPKDITVIDDLAFRLGKKIHPVRALEWDIDTALLKYYSGFTDSELSKLTSSSSAANQYDSAQWMEKDEEYIKLSKGIDAQTESYDDISDMLQQGDTPDVYIPGHDDWTADPSARETDIEPKAFMPGRDSSAANLFEMPADVKPKTDDTDKFAPNPLHELEPEPEPKPMKAPLPPKKAAQPQMKNTSPQKAPATPQPNPLHAKPAQAQPQPQAKAPQRPQTAQPQKQQAPQPAKQQPSAPAPQAAKTKPSAADDAISALTNTARKRFTVQQALIDLLIEKKIISERDLLHKLIKLEGALGGEDE